MQYENKHGQIKFVKTHARKGSTQKNFWLAGLSDSVYQTESLLDWKRCKKLRMSEVVFGKLNQSKDILLARN